MRIQWKPNFIPAERRVCLTRIRWERGVVGVAGGGYSAKLSISLCFEPRDLFVGVYWNQTTVYICVLPCLPIRIKLVKSFGGIFP